MDGGAWMAARTTRPDQRGLETRKLTNTKLEPERFDCKRHRHCAAQRHCEPKEPDTFSRKG